MGTVFWIVVAYSFAGWWLFRTAVRGTVVRMLTKGEEIEISGRRLAMATVLLIVGAVLSGPLTWGNCLRSWLLGREEAANG